MKARVIAKGRGQRAEGMHIDGSWFQDLARVLIALATAIALMQSLGLSAQDLEYKHFHDASKKSLKAAIN
jgi:hypothetical protein